MYLSDSITPSFLLIGEVYLKSFRRSPCHFPFSNPIKYLSSHSFKKHQLSWNWVAEVMQNARDTNVIKTQALPEGPPV